MGWVGGWQGLQEPVQKRTNSSHTFIRGINVLNPNVPAGFFFSDIPMGLSEHGPPGPAWDGAVAGQGRKGHRRARHADLQSFLAFWVVVVAWSAASAQRPTRVVVTREGSSSLPVLPFFERAPQTRRARGNCRRNLRSPCAFSLGRS